MFKAFTKADSVFKLHCPCVVFCTIKAFVLVVFSPFIKCIGPNDQLQEDSIQKSNEMEVVSELIMFALICSKMAL